MKKRYFEEIMTGRRKGGLLSFPLLLISWFYGLAVRLRHLYYDAGFGCTKVSIPVISVGNVTVGGSGKTPFAQYFASKLAENVKVAIISRGYGSERARGKQSLKISPDRRAKYVGDEPLLLAKNVQKADVWVGAHRRESAKCAIEQGSEVAILDDGMQHRKIHRDFEIVCVDANTQFLNGHFLPRGFLRDDPKRMKNADLIIVYGENVDTSPIRKYTQAPIVRMKKEVMNPEVYERKKVALFCGISQPHRFFDMVQSGAEEIMQHAYVDDHAPFEQLDAFAKSAKERGAECIVCTEKDLVKIDPNQELALPVYAVKLSIKPIDGKEHLTELINKIISPLR